MIVSKTGWVPVYRNEHADWIAIRYEEDRPDDELGLGWKWVRVTVTIDLSDL